MTRPLSEKVGESSMSTSSRYWDSRYEELSTKIRYEPLDHDEIRLLSIESHDHQIYGTLFSANINSLPLYRALSYTWDLQAPEYPSQGSPVLRTMYLNDVQIHILPNLFDALYHIHCYNVMASAQSHSVLWVDALCINQGHTFERTAQVGHMHLIYKNAVSVPIWVGLSDSHTFNVIQTVRRFNAMTLEMRRHSGSFITPKNFHDEGYDQVLHRHGIPAVSDPSWEHIREFFGRRWFTRLWVVQEATLGKEAIVYCGLYRIALFELMIFRYDVMTSHVMFHMTDSTVFMRMCRDACGLQSGPGYQRIQEASCKQTMGTTDIYGNIHRVAVLLVQNSGTLNCVDKRDRFYALLGILKEVARVRSIQPLTIQANYALSEQESFVEISKTLISGTESLYLMTLASGLGFPTWVPDLENPRTPLALYKPGDGLYYHCTGGQPDPRLWGSVDGDLLCVYGSYVGELQETSEEGTELLTRGNIVQLLKLLSLHQAQAYALTGEPFADVVARTMLANLKIAPDFTTSIGDILMAWLGRNISDDERTSDGSTASTYMFHESPWHPNDPYAGKSYISTSSTSMQREINADVDRFIGIAQETMYARKLFKTANGLVGLTANTCEPRDQVWIVRASVMPLVLRPLHGSGNGYTFVGDAYVNGIMFGEAVRSDTVWNELVIH